MAIPFVHVQARGSYRELGRAVGEAAREQVQASVDFFRENFASMTGGRLTFDEAERQAPAYADAARRWLPGYVEELEGLAEGARVPFARLLVLNCGEEFTSERAGRRRRRPARRGRGDHCTAVAVVAGGRHIVGHNMDWYVIDAVNNVLFDLTGPDGTRVMGLAGAPYLLMLGMNSHGVANVSNSVHSNDNRIGVPNVFVRRATLEARTLEEARDRGLLAARARGTNQFFADTGGRLWDLETSATAHALHGPLGRRVHGAHQPLRLAGRCSPTRAARATESPVRLATAERLLRTASPRARTGRPRRPRPAHARAVAGPVHLRAPGPGRGAGRPGHDRRQHDLRPGRAAPLRLRRAAVREPVRRSSRWTAA